MTKRLSLLLFLSILETILMPGLLAAGDNLRVKSPEFHAVETVEVEVEVEVEETEKVQTEQLSTNNRNGAETSTTLAKTASSVAIVPKNSINIAGRALEVVDVANTTVDAGGHVNRYGGKFYYGHNSSAVFGGLTALGVGSTFSIVDGGSTTNYRVEKVVIFEKNNNKLQLNGAGSYMNAVAGAIHLGTHYSVSIMTCYGTSYGNGDASHRLVLFANAI